MRGSAGWVARGGGRRRARRAREREEGGGGGRGIRGGGKRKGKGSRETDWLRICMPKPFLLIGGGLSAFS